MCLLSRPRSQEPPKNRPGTVATDPQKASDGRSSEVVGFRSRGGGPLVSRPFRGRKSRISAPPGPKSLSRIATRVKPRSDAPAHAGEIGRPIVSTAWCINFASQGRRHFYTPNRAGDWHKKITNVRLWGYRDPPDHPGKPPPNKKNEIDFEYVAA